MSATEKTNVRGEGILSGAIQQGTTPVNGIAIGPDEVTVGMSGQKKLWPAEALREAAESLSGKNIVKDHRNSEVDAVVGAVTEARYHEEHGVIFKGEVDDEDLAQKISRGRLDVSPRIIHAHVDELEENEDGALVVNDVKEFVNLALVPQGAAESNSIETGRSGMLSVSHEELQQEFVEDGSTDDLDDEDLEIEDPVKSSEESSQESDEEEEEEWSCMCENCSRSYDEHEKGETCDCEECDRCEELFGSDEEEAEESVLSELSVLGADSEDTADVDLTEIEVL